MTMTVSVANLPQAGGVYTVRINSLYNNMGLSLDSMIGSPQTVTFTINSANQAPVLAAPTNQVVVETNLLTFTATASDGDPGQTLTFSLDPGAPIGAGITTNGLFTWTPPIVGAVPQTNRITVRVTDSGSPPLSDSQTFTVVVIKPPRLEPISAPREGLVALSWQTLPGLAYQVRYRDSLGSGSWQTLTNTLVATSTWTWVTNQPTRTAQRFYQVLLLR